MEELEYYIKESERLFSENNIEEAKGLLYRVLEIEPGYAMAHNHIGWALLYYGEDLQLAEKHLRLSLKFDPGINSAYYHLTELLIRTRRLDEALSLLEKAQAIPEVNGVFVYTETGRVYELKRKFCDAIVWYKNAVMRSTDNYEVDNLKASIKRCRYKRLLAIGL